MTSALALKADLHQTLARGLDRVGSTLAGVGVATLIALMLRPGPTPLAALVTVFAVVCYAFLRVNYAVYTACITAYIAFLLAYGGLPERSVVAARTPDTALGGLLAILGHALWPAPRPSWQTL